ncbi:hypothetical protein DL764_006532 [Monosporascus ibericus]|uniref:UBA domain-containing protein n=1 Tax=Monosporascus ibericus TaxID=155417 RepID=A0A4Q4T4I1_9PEZI|nr:hypothetical protein DL764_006532 [Monosporascus ibericus]
MSGLISKRQQARNEKVLQDLVHDVPGNNFCADCQARNPAWASWSVENMKKVGNVASNKIYNPQNKKPSVPVDADEADSAMERFIRSKYIQPGTTHSTKQPRTGSRVSDEGSPPPLPPKTGGRFSFKSGSSTFPLSFRSKRESRSRDGPTSPNGFSDRGSDSLGHKSSKAFGATVQHDSPEAMAQKLAQLREMGFTDDKRNAMVLKGVNGNLEKTIEALVRLGEGGGTSAPAVPARESSLPSRSLTPQPTAPNATFGLSKASPAATRSPTTPTNDPWDISPAQPQSSQSTGTMQNNRNPFYSTNPFGAPSYDPGSSLNQSFQNLSLAPPQQQQQALFPHHTGGLPAPQPLSHQIHQQSLTPPAPQNQFSVTTAYVNGQTYPTPMPQAQQSYNPFLQAPAAQPLSVNTSQAQNHNPFGSNPFMRSPSSIASPSLNQIPEQSQQNVYNTPQTPYGNNPFLSASQPVQQPQHTQQAFYQTQQPAQHIPQQAYQPQRQDKAAILALYSIPSAVPAPASAQVQAQSTPSAETNQAATAQSHPQQPTSPQRSFSVPLAGNKNPFLRNGLGSSGPNAFTNANTPGIPGARSRDSMSLGMEMAWNNGRHSPDAFASLSARSG